MSERTLAILVFGGFMRKAARGGREVDISDPIFLGSEAGQGKKFEAPGKD